jgi:hypothetical protein
LIAHKPFAESTSFRASTQILRSNSAIHLIPWRSDFSDPFMRCAHCYSG